MRENHFTSDFQRVKMANSRDPRMAKVYDKKSIYYHCVSLKKLLSQEEQALMQPLEDSLRQQDKLRPPYGECHHCHDSGHWLGDCPEAQILREQQMFTDKKPTYGQCYICGLEDHWAPNCHKREEHLMNDKESQPKLVDYSDSESSDDEDNIKPPQRKRRAMVIYSDDEDEEEQQSSESTEKQQSSVSTEKQQSSVSTEKPSRKRKASDISDVSPKRRRLDTRKMKTVKRTKTGKKTYCFICKSASHSPRSCTEMVTENWDKPMSCDEPDSIVHIH